jgi:hypothetical protein
MIDPLSHPFFYAKEFMTPEFKGQLYRTYFEKEFPGIDPKDIRSWHTEVATVEAWMKAMRRELRLVVKGYEHLPEITDLAYYGAVKKWERFFDGG